MLKIGFLVSGGGTNLQAVIDAIERGWISNAEISIVIANRENAYALERARKHNISAVFIDGKRVDFENEVIKKFEKCQVELVVLAGFLSILSRSFIEKYRNKIINVHPSLIPSFCGKGFYGEKVHEAVLEYGAKITGATVHFVDEITDNGAIIMQKSVDVKIYDTAQTLQKRVMEEAEWKILPKSIDLIANGKVKLDGRKVIVSSW